MRSPRPVSPRLDPETLALLAALLAGDWAVAEAVGTIAPATRPAASSPRSPSSTSSAGCAPCRTWTAARDRREPVAKTHKDAVDFVPVDWTGLLSAGVSRRAPCRGHVAVVMDGNGRWANRKGLTRIEGHRAGEASLLDVVAGAIQAGVKHLSVYAFSTENWSRSPDEVRFLMGFNRDVLHRRRDQLNEWGVRVRWAGRKPRLWASVIKELQFAERAHRGQRRAHPHDVRQLRRPQRARGCGARDRRGRRGRPAEPSGITEKTIQRHLYQPDLPDVDLFVRSSGEQRTSNFMLWQSRLRRDGVPRHAVARLPPHRPLARDRALRERDRRFGGAKDAARW